MGREWRARITSGCRCFTDDEVRSVDQQRWGARAEVV